MSDELTCYGCGGTKDLLGGPIILRMIHPKLGESYWCSWRCKNEWFYKRPKEETGETKDNSTKVGRKTYKSHPRQDKVYEKTKTQKGS